MNGIRYVKCQLCGEQGKAEDFMLVGGCYAFLCPKCRPIVNKVIRQFIRHLRELPFEIVVKILMKESSEGSGSDKQ